MLLLVGLGNPGPGYANHRHNIGYRVADEIVRRHALGPARVRFRGQTHEGVVDGEKVLVLKPTTYMNHSGESVAEAARFYKLALADIVVVHDELDLAPGKLKVKTGGGSAGHNGLRNITAHLGPDYRRVRVGIGHPGHKNLVTSFVLHDFAKADRAWIDPLVEAIADAFPLLVAGDDAGFTTRVALLRDPPPTKAA